MYGNALAEGLVGLLIVMLVAAAAVGGLAVWLLPKLWDWLKPIIHSFTG